MLKTVVSSFESFNPGSWRLSESPSLARASRLHNLRTERSESFNGIGITETSSLYCRVTLSSANREHFRHLLLTTPLSSEKGSTHCFPSNKQRQNPCHCSGRNRPPLLTHFYCIETPLECLLVFFNWTVPNCHREMEDLTKTWADPLHYSVHWTQSRCVGNSFHKVFLAMMYVWLGSISQPGRCGDLVHEAEATNYLGQSRKQRTFVPSKVLRNVSDDGGAVSWIYIWFKVQFMWIKRAAWRGTKLKLKMWFRQGVIYIYMSFRVTTYPVSSIEYQCY